MPLTQLSCEDFVEKLGGKDPVPGGGGASALVGAVGLALGQMVGSLTLGKKKYADVQTAMEDAMQQSAALQKQLMGLVQKDAEVFEPLSKAYGLPSETPQQKEHKNTVMQQALKGACEVPLEIMQACCAALDIIEIYAEKGSKMVLSDAGVAAAVCKGALQGASLNVFVNTALMSDKAFAQNAEDTANQLLAEYTQKADDIFNAVKEQL